MGADSSCRDLSPVNEVRNVETGVMRERIIVCPHTMESTMTTSYKLLQLALVVFGAVMLLLYPLAMLWPSGWIWHSGAPYQSEYFMMIVGVYATLGVFLINAARNPKANLSLDLVHRVVQRRARSNHGGAIIR